MSLPNYTNPLDPNAPPRSLNAIPVRKDTKLSAGIKGILIALVLFTSLFVVWVTLQVFGPSYNPPDLSNYVHLETLNGKALNLDDPDQRIIMVGDLHGMIHSLDNLLDKLDYNSSHDRLIHLGDITSKGPHSNELLSRFARFNTTGVRGNNDQKVIEWYSWFSWVKTHRGGAKWLRALFEENLTPKDAEKMGLWKSLKYKYPKDWEWGGDHFTIAKDMAPEDFHYLASLPIVLYLPTLHTFMVHAGLLPIDPQHSIHGHNQPLAHLPKKPKLRKDGKNIEAVRIAQELSILTDIPGNREPFIKLNMRDVHDGVPVRKGPAKHDDNSPWSELWNDVIKRCKGFDAEGRKELPCYPFTVVYSHASSRGLDLKRWSKGLDTGCVNGDGLTALILHGGPATESVPPSDSYLLKGDDDDDDDQRDEMVRFGENRRARLVTVPCPIPPEIDPEID
ncbi:hypothetical protein FRC03_003644 [Tulasnella sp. 419]|nr:hypothetical protein FRC03_003644 [Tulasnella sp. 419]